MIGDQVPPILLGKEVFEDAFVAGWPALPEGGGVRELLLARLFRQGKPEDRRAVGLDQRQDGFRRQFQLVVEADEVFAGDAAANDARETPVRQGEAAGKVDQEIRTDGVLHRCADVGRFSGAVAQINEVFPVRHVDRPDGVLRGAGQQPAIGQHGAEGGDLGQAGLAALERLVHRFFADLFQAAHGRELFHGTLQHLVRFAEGAGEVFLEDADQHAAVLGRILEGVRSAVVEEAQDACREDQQQKDIDKEQRLPDARKRPAQGGSAADVFRIGAGRCFQLVDLHVIYDNNRVF
ncbi:MAG: hypothetical protein HKUEN07_17050 [Rhodocyclaceae bacterium]|uniref:Uncharacterized protein n=1 Tax=Candidatus Desulfobacillus denitrificans TaxID=2608985 RepID=A0A809S4H2_9PROT|nr:hypothetical protein DSYM_13000 [Candidatus Desulfobacillus denitrificans]GIK44169.1 MAG: hypothetical protein BroJett012_00720 [Betaproteobacteria bacterium]GJQ55136.1 MAG: hypothetical protein HKUEN07_17050 [Rhodocyclaceae bacterium]